MADEQTEAQQQRNELKREELIIEADLAETERERLEVSEKLNELEKKKLAVAREKAQEAREELEEQKKYLASLEQNSDISEEILELERQKVEKMEAELRALEASAAVQEDYVEQQEKSLEILKETVKVQEENNALLEKAFKRGQDQIGGALQLNDAWKEGTFGIMMQAKEQGLQAEAMQTYLQGARESVSLNSILGNLLGAISSRTIEVAKAQDDAVANFAKSTGAGRSYANVIRSVNVENRQFGVDASDASRAAIALYQNFATLDSQTIRTQKNLIATAARLDEIGIASQTSAEVMFTLHKGFNMSADASAELAKRFADLAGSGMDANMVMSNFIQNADHLHRYSGPKMKKVFEELTHMARNTGIEMSTLVGIAEQFDTFESAASTVGRLNAVFGGPYLNTLDMMNKSTDEQIEALHGLFRQTGMNFDQLGKWDKMMIANTMGFNSVADAAKFFNSSLVELTKRNKELEEQEKRIQAAQTVMEKLTQIAQTLSITIGPLVDGVSTLASKLLEVEQATRMGIEGFDVGAVSLGVLAIAAFKLLVPIGSLTASFLGMAPAMTGVATAAGPAAAGITAVGTAGYASGVGLLLIGGAALLAGAGFAVAAYGASKLVDSISQLSPDQLWAITSALLATSLLAPAAPFLALAAISVTALAGAYYLLAQAIDQIDLEKLNSITNFNNSVVSLAETGADSVQTVKQVVEIIRDTVQKAEEAGGTDTIQKIKEMIEVILGTTGGGTAAANPAGAARAGGVATHKIELDFMLGDRSIKKFVYNLIDNKFDIGGDNIA